MQGSIQKRVGKTGKVAWTCVVDARPDPVTGKRRQLRLSADTKRELEGLVAAHLHDRRTGAFVARDNQTIRAYLARWIEHYSPPKESTWIAREAVVRRHLIPALGTIRLGDLGTMEIDALYRSKVAAGVSPAHVRSMHATLRMALAQAVRWRLIVRNPAEDADPPPIPRTKPVVWSETDAARFFATTRDHQAWPLCVILATCQLRVSEALALHWSDIDWDRAVLRVERTLTKTKQRAVVEGAPKSEAGRRAVALPLLALAALREQRARQQARQVVTGWVFDRGDGERLHAETFRAQLERAMQDAGVPRLTPHGLRHTGATALARAGVSPKTLAARLGHSSVTTTFDLYAHALVDDQRDAAEAFAARLDRTA